MNNRMRGQHPPCRVGAYLDVRQVLQPVSVELVVAWDLQLETDSRLVNNPSSNPTDQAIQTFQGAYENIIPHLRQMLPDALLQHSTVSWRNPTLVVDLLNRLQQMKPEVFVIEGAVQLLNAAPGAKAGRIVPSYELTEKGIETAGVPLSAHLDPKRCAQLTDQTTARRAMPRSPRKTHAHAHARPSCSTAHCASQGDDHCGPEQQEPPRGGEGALVV